MSQMTVTISIPTPALEGIFDECDRFNMEETGGRLLGSYSWTARNLHIDVQALIAAGPNARRTQTSFFQDGEYQERMFRVVERTHPSIEHLGNWHTHHVNGLRALSVGDCETYQKNVNSLHHNTDFFYALLVTHRTPREPARYAIRHFIFMRYTHGFIEVPAWQVNRAASILQL